MSLSPSLRDVRIALLLLGASAAALAVAIDWYEKDARETRGQYAVVREDARGRVQVESFDVLVEAARAYDAYDAYDVADAGTGRLLLDRKLARLLRARGDDAFVAKSIQLAADHFSRVCLRW